MKNDSVRLEELVVGKLPDRILQSIEDMEMTMEEVNEWSGSIPPLRMVSSEDEVVLYLRAKIPKKRLIAILAGLGVIISTGATFVVANLDKITIIARILKDGQ